MPSLSDCLRQLGLLCQLPSMGEWGVRLNGVHGSFTVLEAGRPSSRCWQVQFSERAISSHSVPRTSSSYVHWGWGGHGGGGRERISTYELCREATVPSIVVSPLEVQCFCPAWW